MSFSIYKPLFYIANDHRKSLWSSLLLMGMAVGSAPLACAAMLTGLTIQARNMETSIDLDIDQSFPSPQLFWLEGPKRLVIDINGLTRRPGLNFTGGGQIVSVRFGTPKPGVGRLVFELTGPAMLVGTKSYEAAENGKPRLSVELKPTDPAAFTELTHRDKLRIPGTQTPINNGTGLDTTPDKTASQATDKTVGSLNVAVKTALATPAPAPAKTPPEDKKKSAAEDKKEDKEPEEGESFPPPVATSPQAIAIPEPQKIPAGKIRGRKPVVVIDAGHGGQDPGAPSVVKGRVEKEVTLAIARAIKAAVEVDGQVKVVLTRATDMFIPLGGRVEIARKAGADLFISIHADSIVDPNVRGATVYTLSARASDKEAEKLAAKENKADIISGINLGGESPDVTNILIDLAQRETKNYSAEFAQTAVREMSKTVFFRSNFHRFAGFVVLKAPDVPSVLIETGYMSNDADSKFLLSPEGQNKLARAVAQAIGEYFDRRVASN